MNELSVELFISQLEHSSNNERILRKDMYDYYLNFCDENMLNKSSYQVLFNKLREYNFGEIKTRGYWYFWAKLKDRRMLLNEIDKSKMYMDAFNTGYQQGRADATLNIYNKLDAGVCDICEHGFDGCVEVCNKNNWEMETFKKWLGGLIE